MWTVKLSGLSFFISSKVCLTISRSSPSSPKITSILILSNPISLAKLNENKFRKDLYFRLNVLPLKIKPLRERTDDVFLIFDSFKKNLHCDFELCDEIKDIFKTYCWEGNIRELRNIAEYFSYLDKKIIEVSDLPEYILDSIDIKKISSNKSKSSTDSSNNISSYNFKRSLNEYIFILEQLNNAYNLKQRIGRRKLYDIALLNNVFLTEQQIRSILIELQDLGLVSILSGRGGSVITDSGINFLKEQKEV